MQIQKHSELASHVEYCFSGTAMCWYKYYHIIIIIIYMCVLTVQTVTRSILNIFRSCLFSLYNYMIYKPIPSLIIYEYIK